MKLACAADEELCPLESNAAKGLAADDYLILASSPPPFPEILLEIKYK